jgi:hypothetical protein
MSQVKSRFGHVPYSQQQYHKSSVSEGQQCSQGQLLLERSECQKTPAKQEPSAPVDPGTGKQVGVHF